MANKRSKISVIGSGYTGATTALMIAQKELGDVVLVDIPDMENPTKGKALDMMQASPIQGYEAIISGTSDYAQTKDSDVVIITAGMARKPGMSRDDLVQTNEKIMTSIAEQVAKYSPHAILIVLTNPVDAMTYTAFKVSGFPKERVIGQSGVLDSARFRTFIAEALQIAVQDVTGVVLGGHGDDMVPLVRYCNAGGVPLTSLLDHQTIDQIVERTRKGGAEIVSLLGNGSAYYAPAAALVEMAEAVIKDQRRILPAIAYLEGEYQLHDVYIGVPTIIGANGIEKVLEFDLTDEEQQAFEKSAQSVQSVLQVLSFT